MHACGSRSNGGCSFCVVARKGEGRREDRAGVYACIRFLQPMRIARANPLTPSTWVFVYYVWSVWSCGVLWCRVVWQVPESGFPEDGDGDFAEEEDTMEEDDEGDILECRVVHGFRWYRVRVTTRAVSTQVRACSVCWYDE